MKTHYPNGVITLENLLAIRKIAIRKTRFNDGNPSKFSYIESNFAYFREMWNRNEKFAYNTHNLYKPMSDTILEIEFSYNRR